MLDVILGIGVYSNCQEIRVEVNEMQKNIYFDDCDPDETGEEPEEVLCPFSEAELEEMRAEIDQVIEQASKKEILF